MTANASFKDQILVDFQDEEKKSINNATNAIKNGLVSFCSTTTEKPEFNVDYERMLNLTALSIKMYANSHYKTSAYLEPSEIDQVKIALNNYTKHNEKLEAFKTEIVGDLTEFQNQIKTKHVQRLAELTKEKQFCEKQIRILDCEKHKRITERLSKVLWPYDEKTKEYDHKITKLQIQAEQYANKIAKLQKMRPAANEKDILIYGMHLKEKFANK